jgi:hypothetical protein
LTRSCYICGTSERELRPYGKDGQDICFSCMTSTPELEQEAQKQFGKLLDAAGKKTDAAMLTPEGPVPYIGKVP